MAFSAHFITAPAALAAGLTLGLIAAGAPEVSAEIVKNTRPVTKAMKGSAQTDLEAVLEVEFCPAVNSAAGAAVCDVSCEQIPYLKIICDADGVRHIHATPEYLVNLVPVVP